MCKMLQQQKPQVDWWGPLFRDVCVSRIFSFFFLVAQSKLLHSGSWEKGSSCAL